MIKKIIKRIIPNFFLFQYAQYVAVRRNEAELKKHPNLHSNNTVFVSGHCDFGKQTQAGNNASIVNTSIGDYSYIVNDCLIANCTIGKYCSIASRVAIGIGIHPSREFVSTHASFYLDKTQGTFVYADDDYVQKFSSSLPVIVGNDVWIGIGAIIKDGVTIGDGAIIGAGAVVVKNVEPYSIVGGVPAKLIRYRFEKEEIDFLQKFKWWDKDEIWLKENWKSFFDIKEFIKLKSG